MMQEQKEIKTVDVAAGIVFNAQGQCLLSSRPQGKPYAGYWEFAGGKLERGETALAALQREWREELGVEITRATPWLCKRGKTKKNTIDACRLPVSKYSPKGLLTMRTDCTV